MLTYLVEKDVPVPMRDGVCLSADVYRQDGAGPQPVLLARTPYGKDAWFGGPDSTDFDVFRALQAGYVVVVQDCRGRGRSDGDFRGQNVQERPDGVDTIAWASAQPWSSGAVGTFGGSYTGMTQWMAAREAPPALKAMAPVATYSDHYEGMQYQGGVKLMLGLTWSYLVTLMDIPRRAERGERSPSELADVDIDAALRRLPLADHPVLGELAPWYAEWLEHDRPGQYWAEGSPRAGYEAITAPALNVGGWYDIFLWGTLQNFVGMRRRGRSAAARRSRLVVGPWSHTNDTQDFPDRGFGAAASATTGLDLPGLQLRWFDRWLNSGGQDDDEPSVQIFVMGIDEWRHESDWPLPDTDYRDYYLHSGGSANTRRGDGRLTEEKPDAEPPDAFLYNPLRPVPTVGGPVFAFGVNDAGPRDQRGVEDRDDVLVYSTPALERPVEVTGPVLLTLLVDSSAKDTDFTGKLVDVHPDGQAINLTEGIMRARYRNSMTQPELMENGQIYELTVDMWATSNVFLPGHRIRLEVSSSNFPRFARNTNHGGDVAYEGVDACVPAINRVFHDAAHPSRLVLPVIERAGRE